ncbi:O-antigen polymerase [Photobacterium leiognathi]|uniref:O-antigen polymerase n=1 Tax=Photobacterium leiognathi TaxID=553611 RepID=UPI0029816CF1|nr:O-antigen polymerase [Photobacterium leiognathi]
MQSSKNNIYIIHILVGILISFGQVFNSQYTHLYIIAILLAYITPFYLKINNNRIDKVTLLYAIMIFYSFLLLMFFYINNQTLNVSFNSLKGIFCSFFLILFLNQVKDFTFLLKGIFAGYVINIVYGISQIFGFSKYIIFIPERIGFDSSRITMLFSEPSACASYILMMQIIFLIMKSMNVLSNKRYNYLLFLNIIIMFFVASKAGIVLFIVYLLLFHFNLRIVFAFSIFVLISSFFINYLIENISAFNQIYRLFSILYFNSNFHEILNNSSNTFVVRFLSPVVGFIGIFRDFPLGVSPYNIAYAYLHNFEYINISFNSPELTNNIEKLQNLSFKNYIVNNYYFFGPLFLYFIYCIFKDSKKYIKYHFRYIFFALMLMSFLELFNYIVWFVFIYFYTSSLLDKRKSYENSNLN